MKTHRYFALILLCLAGLIAVILVSAVAILDHAQRTRGIAYGFPDPIEPYIPNRPAVGVNVALEQYDDAALRENLNRIEASGLSWVRQTFAWSQIEPERGQFDWDNADRIVAAVSDTSLNLIAVLDTAPQWSTNQPANQPTSPPTNLQDFAEFARAFAQRYGDRIDYYQIWDEPNLGDRWNGEVNPVAYAELLRQARDAIREVDPHAVIILAGLAPTVETSAVNMADWLFLRKLYESGARDTFDVVAGKPYGFDTGPDDRRVDAEVLNFSHLILLREEMVAHGDAGKALWASHFGWNTHPGSTWGQATPEQQVDWTQAAIQRARHEWPWLGVMVIENWEPNAPPDAPRWGFSISKIETGFLRESRVLPGVGYYPAAAPVRPGVGEYTANPHAAFQGNWRFGELGADWSTTGEKAAFIFTGSAIALRVRRAADRANLYVTIDSEPANALPRDERGSYLQLIPPVRNVIDVTTIPLATGLSDGPHTVEFVTERGWNQWSLIGWSAGQFEDRAVYDAALWALGVAGLVFAYGAIRNAQRTQWGAISSLHSQLSNTTRIILTAITALIFYASLWLTWGVDVAAAYRRLGEPANVLITLAAATIFTLSPWLILTVLSGAALAILILLRLDLGLMLVAFFAPFFLLPANLFYRFSSMVELTLILCVVAWGVRRLYALRNTRYALRFPYSILRSCAPLDWAVLAFFIVATLSLFAANYFEFALREWRIIILEPVVFYALLRSSPLDRAAVWRIVDALVLAGALVAAIGLVQYAFNLNLITAEEGTRRLASVYGSPNNVALFLGRVFPIALACALLGRGRRRAWYALALTPILMAIVLTQSRGALFLGVPAAVLAIGLLAGGRWVWAALGAIGLGVVAAIPFLDSPRVQALFSGEGTSVFRLALWRSTLDLIREHPLLGVGPDNFLYAYRGRYMLPEAWQESGLSHPHNVVLDFSARLGLLGLGVFIWMQIGFWRIALPLRKLAMGESASGDASYRVASYNNRALAIGLMASMVDFLAHGLVDAAYFIVDLAFVFMLTLALAQRMKEEGGGMKLKPDSSSFR
ncbi:MAG TPA: O-antigen ligase family protein [Anaerolineae bacterium]|nr:O-antigen ligase family protein [Anaerolineae bacterium]